MSELQNQSPQKRLLDIKKIGDSAESITQIKELLGDFPGFIPGWLELGTIQRQLGDRKLALTTFQEALKLNSQSVAANFNVAVELRELGDLEASEQHFLQALADDSNHFHSLIHMGILQQRKQKHNLALDYFEKAIARNPTKIEPYLYKVDILCNQGRFDESKNQIKEFLANFPDCLSGWIKLGTIHRRLGDRKSALTTFEEGIKHLPHNQKLKLELSIEQLYCGQVAECRHNLQEILERDPKYEGAIIRLGEVYRRENDRPQALRLFQKALGINSQSVAANFNVAVELRELGDLEASEQHFLQALEGEPNHFNALMHMGILQQRKQNYNLALDYFQKAITTDPTRIEAHLIQLNTLCDLGLFEQAKNNLKILQKTYPEESRIFIISGHFARRLGERKKALKYFRLAQEKADSQDQKLEAQILISEELGNLGRFDKAIKLIDLIIKKNPDQLRYQTIKGRILQQKPDLIAAANIYNQILSQTPEHLESRIELAKIHSQSGQIETAINLLEETYQSSGANIQIFIQLGLLNQVLEDFPTANQWYQKACQEYPYNHQGYYHLANSMFLQGETDSAIKLLQETQVTIPHSLPIIIKLIELQIRLGNFDLSYQLLQDKLQKFPHDVQLLWQLCRLHMEQGDYSEALDVLDQISTDHQAWIRHTENLRANAYFYQYNYQKAEEHFKQAIASTPIATDERNRLAMILMLTGRIEEARQEFKIATEELDLKTPPGKSFVPLKGHPAMVINELRINPPLMAKLQAAQQETESKRILALSRLLAQAPNYLGTALYLARELREQGIFDNLQQALLQNTTSHSTIPKRIVQFWDAPEPPKDVQRICQSWRDLNPEYEYIRFSLKTAVTFVKEHYDRKVLKAFANCDHPATQADFFRLAYLNKMGGFYADADDLCRQSLDIIVNHNPELVILQEDFACFGNNFLACIPGQTMIHRAFYQAVDNLSDYCNESPWFKTGPGLITSIVCSSLLPYLSYQDYQIWPRLLVLTQAQLRKIINQHMFLPYKRTAKNWQHNSFVRQSSKATRQKQALLISS